MDSYSGSLQSSSGDEEYDSRAADSPSISAFMNPSSTHLGAMSNPPRPQPPQHHLLGHQHHHNTQINSPMFDPALSGYNFDPLSRSFPNQNPLLNLDMLIWSQALRSDPNCTDPPNILPSTSSPPTQTRTTAFRNSSAAAVQFPPMPENAVRPSGAVASSTDLQTSTNTGSGAVVVRNSKKRSRASRRAPTTVLTTDTTNFRAMVQEFTGIPAPPFTTSSSPFPRTRLDLFSSSLNNLLDSSNSTTTPPPLLRPFAQKIQPPPPPFVSSSSSNNNNNNTNMTISNSTSSINYQLLPVANSDLGAQVSMHNNNSNPMLSFQSLLHSSLKYPLPNSNILGSRPPTDLHEFGLGHGHVNSHLTALSNMEAGAAASRRSNISSSSNWAGDGSNHNEVGDHQAAGLMLRSVNDNNYGNPRHQQQQVTNGKGNNYLSSSSSNLHGDRGGSENVPTRSEGMVESWICSSD